MLTADEVLLFLKKTESENIERTRAFDKAEKMGQAICAFANDLADRRTPGYLFLGVENDGRIAGKRIADRELASLGGLKTDGNLLPPPAMAMERFEFPEGDVVVVEVFPSRYPPIRYNGQVWVRVGPRKSIATEDDVHILEERRARYGLRFEEFPCETARLEDLDLDLFRNVYLPRAFAAEIIEEDDRSVEAQLAALRFFDRNKKCPTNLGVILFGRHPEQFIPSAYVQYVKFSGEDRGGDVLREHAFKGPLAKTAAELDTFARTTLSAKRPVLVSAFREETLAPYPEWALRELIFNALIHRDYCIGNAPAKICEYGDSRLEISNPGGLFGLATPDNFPHVSDYRNPLLAESLKVLGYVNKFNRGIAKVRTELRKNGNPQPTFDVNHRTEFRVTVLPNRDRGISPSDGAYGEINGEINGTINSDIAPNGTINGEINPAVAPSGTINGEINPAVAPSGEINGEINPNIAPSGTINGEIKIKKAIAENPGIKREGLLLKTKIPLRTIDRLLRSLKDSGAVEYRGSRKTGGWYPRT